MISPDDTFTIYLDAHLPEDQRQPEAKRPALVYRFGTAGELREHERILDAINNLHGVAYIEAVLERASFNLVETRNLTNSRGEPTQDLADVFTIGDLKAMARKITITAELSEADQKKSESPSPSSAAACADDVSPAESV